MSSVSIRHQYLILSFCFRCVDEATCRTKWLTESADQDYCSKYDVVKNPNAFECHFCCHGDYCNTGIKPKDSVLVQKQSGK